MKDKPKQFTLQDIVEDLDRRDSLEGVFNYAIGDKVAIVPDKEKLIRIMSNYGMGCEEMINTSVPHVFPTNDPQKIELIEDKFKDAIENSSTKFDDSFIKELNSILGSEMDDRIVKRVGSLFKTCKNYYEVWKLFSEDVLSGKEILKGEVVGIDETTVEVKFNEFATLNLRYLDVYKHVTIELNLDDL